MKSFRKLRRSKHAIPHNQEGDKEEKRTVKSKTKWYYQDEDSVTTEDERDWKGRTILYHEVANDDVVKVTMLLQQGCDVNVPDFFKTTPLLLSVSQSNVKIAQLLIEAGADVNVANCQGRTPLIISAKRRNAKLAKLLIDAKADVNAADEDGWTPLHESAKRGDEELSKLFLDADADVNAKDRYERTPLHLSARLGYKEITKHLINCGASVNTTGFQGRTALHESSMAGHTDVVSQLLFQEASVDVQDVNLWTPLHESSASGHFDIVKSLLLFGANVVIRNKDGDTPLMLATMRKHTTIERILRQKQAYVEGTLRMIDKQSESEKHSCHDPGYEYPDPILDSRDTVPHEQIDKKHFTSQAVPPRLPPKKSSTTHRSTSEPSGYMAETGQWSEGLHYSDSTNCYNEVYDVPPSENKCSVPHLDEEDCTTHEALPPLPPRITLKRRCYTTEPSSNTARTSHLSEERNSSNEYPCPLLDTTDAEPQEPTDVDNHSDKQTTPQAIPPKPRPRTSTRQSYTNEPYYANTASINQVSEERNSSNDPDYEYLCPKLDTLDAVPHELTDNQSDVKLCTSQAVPPKPRPRKTSVIQRSTSEPSANTSTEGMSQVSKKNVSIHHDYESCQKLHPPEADQSQ